VTGNRHNLAYAEKTIAVNGIPGGGPWPNGNIRTNVNYFYEQAIITRVVLNQHLDDSHDATLLRIETADGAAISVTPDHVIAIGGHDSFAAVH
jgi:hypothetical protein